MPATIILQFGNRAIGPLPASDPAGLVPTLERTKLSSPNAPQTVRYPSFRDGVMLCGAFAGPDMVSWIAHTVDGGARRQNLGVIVVDRNTRTEATMSNCLLTKVTLPALDKGSNADAIMRVAFRPEKVSFSRSSNVGTLPAVPALRPWKVNEFEFAVEGMGPNLGIQTIDAMVIQQGVKEIYSTPDSDPDIEPTNISESNLALTVSLNYGQKFYDWFAAVNARGGGNQFERKGSLRYGNAAKPVATLRLDDMAPLTITRSGNTLRIELYCVGAAIDAF